MDLHPLVYHEWRDDHALSRRSLIWINDHAEPGDQHPLQTAISQLRAEAYQGSRMPCESPGSAW